MPFALRKAPEALLCLALIFLANACVSSSLPQPGGPYPVGTREFIVHACMVEADGSPSCPATDVLVQAWYPAAPKAEPLAPYILNADRAVPAIAEASHAPEFLVRKVAEIQTNSHVDAPVSSAEKTFPLLIFSHGYHSLRGQNTALLEQLASDGNIIFSIQYAYDALTTVMPGGEVIRSVAPAPDTEDLDRDDSLRGGWTNRRIGEARAVLANLNLAPADLLRAIDRKRIAALGHSMGGSTSTALCREEDSMKGCINIDGPIRGTRQEATLKRPLLFIEAEMPQYENAAEEKFYKNRLAILKTTAQAGYLHLRIADSGHLNFTDFPVISSFPLNWFSRAAGSLDEDRSIGITYYLVEHFLDHVFKGDRLILTKEELGRFKEVQVIEGSEGAEAPSSRIHSAGADGESFGA